MIPIPPHNIHLPFEQTPMPVAVMAADYPNGAVVTPHRHRRAQLLYAIEGVMVIETEVGRWVAPPTWAVWLPAGLEHGVRMSGNVRLRTVYVEPGASACMPPKNCVVAVSPLLRELILAAVEIPLDYQAGSRHDMLMELLLAEIAATPRLPLYLPMPSSPKLRAICDAIMQTPDQPHAVADWAHSLGVAEKTLYRQFGRETGMTLGRWRQHARLLLALEQLAHGKKIIDVALDHGYTSQSAFTAMFRKHFDAAPSAFYR